jgi:hypothetical protein
LAFADLGLIFFDTDFNNTFCRDDRCRASTLDLWERDVVVELREEVKVVVKIIAKIDSSEFTPDLEELPVLLEEYIEDLIHEVSGIAVKDVTVERR